MKYHWEVIDLKTDKVIREFYITVSVHSEYFVEAFADAVFRAVNSDNPIINHKDAIQLYYKGKWIINDELGYLNHIYEVTNVNGVKINVQEKDDDWI